MEKTQDIKDAIILIIGFFGSLIVIAWVIKIVSDWLDKKLFKPEGKENHHERLIP